MSRNWWEAETAPEPPTQADATTGTASTAPATRQSAASAAQAAEESRMYCLHAVCERHVWTTAHDRATSSDALPTVTTGSLVRSA